MDFAYLSAKAKIDFESEKNGLSGVANIRMRKDSLIWISLSPGLGIEVARIIISTDSIKVIDKINKVYLLYDFKELSTRFDFDINYHLVESVILGNLIYPYDRERVAKNTNTSNYKQYQRNFIFDNTIGNKTMKLEKMMVTDTSSNSTISVNYSQFQLVDEEVFPFMIEALLTRGDATETNVKIEYKQTQIENKPIRFPFNIPQRYDRK